MMTDFNDIGRILDESNRTYKKDILDFDAVGEKLHESKFKSVESFGIHEFEQQIKLFLKENIGLSDNGQLTKRSPEQDPKPNSFYSIPESGSIQGVRLEISTNGQYYDDIIIEIYSAQPVPMGCYEILADNETWIGKTFEEFEKDFYEAWKKIKSESLNEAYAAAVYNPEDIRGETFYIDKDGELRDYLHQAKIFDTEEEAEEWAEENCPYNWNAYGSKLDEATVAQAKRFATRKHGETGAVRKATGQPYIVHPEGVAALVKENGGDDEQIQAAWLHDTMEDTGTWEEDLREKFGDRVADLVSELTNDDFAIRSIGKEKYMSNKLVNLSDDALLIKLSDFLYNIKDYCPMKTLERMKKNLEALNFSGRKLDDKCNRLLIDCLKAIDEEM